MKGKKIISLILSASIVLSILSGLTIPISAVETSSGTDENGFSWTSNGNGITITGYNPAKDNVRFHGIKYNGHYYGFSQDKKTWNEAQKDCEANGGHLVTIADEKEQKAVQKLLSYDGSGTAWIGATDEASEGEWIWCTGEIFSYSNWNSGEPNNDKEEDYAGIYVDGFKWNDWNGTTVLNYICEWEVQPSKDIFSEFKFYGLEYNGHYYGLSQNKLSWEEAKAGCEEVGGLLACINTENEQAAIEKLLGFGHSENHWIGAYKDNGLWQWLDGKSIEYTNWAPGEPNGNASTAQIYYNNFKWDDSSGTNYYICEWNTQPADIYFKNCMESIAIPQKINDTPVIAIGNSAFANKKSISYIEIPNSVTSIGSYAFNGCKSLAEITIPNSVTAIGAYAFNGCSGISEITIPDSVTSIGRYAFAGTKITEITIPATVKQMHTDDYYEDRRWSALCGAKELRKVIFEDRTTIPSYALQGCSQIAEVVIPDSVTTIGRYAFRGCSSLITINIPESVCVINDYAFNNCSALKALNINAGIVLESYKIEAEKTHITSGNPKWSNSSASNGYCVDYAYDLDFDINVETTGEFLLTEYAAFNDRTFKLYVDNEFIGIIRPTGIGTSTISKYDFAKLELKNGKHNIRIMQNVNNTPIFDYFMLTPVSATGEIVGGEASAYYGGLTVIGSNAFAGTVLTDIYYTGAEEQWKKINISNGNELLLNANFHFGHTHVWGEWNDDYKSTCSKRGKKHKTCTLCGYNYIEFVDALGHEYTSTNTAPTCTEKGYTTYICSRCNDTYRDNYIDALGHAYGDWIVEKEPNCTAAGSKYRICSVCKHKDVAVIPAKGHNYSTKTVEATCTMQGYTLHTCSVCSATYKDNYTSKKEHSYGAWIVDKQATVLAEGKQYRFCTVCNHTEYQTIERVTVDLDKTTKYGLANFTVVNAQTKQPIKGANIFISTENDGENTFATDANGKVSVILPVGKQTVSVYAGDCKTRNVTINVKAGTNEIPFIGLSDMNTYDVKVTHHLMTKEEIEDAGIDVDASDNNHVYKYELDLVFVPEVDWLSITYYMDDAGNVTPGGGGSGSGSGSGSGGAGGGCYSGSWVSSGESGGNETYYRAVNNDTNEVVNVYPVSEYFYLIIRGEVRWLKEMFDVEMLIVNNSQTDTLENLTATLNLPKGLSLATMKEKQQTLSVALDKIPEGGSSSVHWYVRGDTAGSYQIEANLKGMVMPFEEEINDTFKAQNALQVWAGDALHLDFEVPGAAYYGEDYPIKITLTNVSDITLYNVSHYVTGIEQSRMTYYSDGSVEKEIYMDVNTHIGDFVPEFKPGDKIVIELSVNILFRSKLMEHKLNSLIGIVDNVEKLIKSYQAIKSGLDICDSLISGVSGASKAIDAFVKSGSGTTDKLTLAKELKKEILDFQLKYSKSENRTLDASVKLASSVTGTALNAFTQNPNEWIEKSSVKDIENLIKGVRDLGNSISNNSEESINKFNVFDSIRTLISAIPVVFTLKDFFIVEDEDNTTSIPYSISVTPNTPHYFGVQHLGRHLSNIAKVATADIIKGAIPSYFFLIPGVSNNLSVDEAKQEIAVVENEIEQFKAKSATGDIKYKVYVVRNEDMSKSKAIQTCAALNEFELTANADDAVLENGILTFTGDATIGVKPLSTQNGTLVIESDDGSQYTYELNVIDKHECDENNYKVIIPSTPNFDGFAVKCCSVCEDVMDVVILPASECKHSFSDWITEIVPTCTEGGLVKRTCSKCGYIETKITDVDNTAHDFGEWKVTTPATCTNKGTETRYCSRCDATETRNIAALGHNYKAVITAPTCTEQGFTTYTCSKCKDSYKADYVKAKGHTDSKWKITKQPSLTEEGVKTLYCKDCGKAIKTEVIPKLTHGKVNGVKIDDISLNYKKSTTLKPQIDADNGVKYTVKYSSSNTKVATVDKNGKVTATKRGSGSATITCTVTDEFGNTVKDTCKVNVKLSFGQILITYVLFGWIWY